MPAAALLCLVVAIADGDTLTARCGEPGHFEEVKVRLAEIDAPEKDQPFGQRSKQALATLCAQTQTTIRPVSQDRYGRTVAHVECRGKDAGAEQLRAGLAWVYVRYSADPALYALQDAAKAARQGLWSRPDAVPPWEFRHPAAAVPAGQAEVVCHTGPRGGRYTLTAGGHKHYGC